MNTLIGVIKLLIKFLTDVLAILEKEEKQDEKIAISWTEEFIPVGRKNRPVYAMSPKWITIHNTGNSGVGANAKAHANYIKSDSAANLPVSWHFTCDDKDIIQHLPLTENGWHSSDGSGPGNRQSIGIEICQNSDSDMTKAEDNAHKLIAWLAENVDSLLPFPECMKTHEMWSGKRCPNVILSRPNGWALFIDGVEKYMNKVVKE